MRSEKTLCIPLWRIWRALEPGCRCCSILHLFYTLRISVSDISARALLPILCRRRSKENLPLRRDPYVAFAIQFEFPKVSIARQKREKEHLGNSIWIARPTSG